MKRTGPLASVLKVRRNTEDMQQRLLDRMLSEMSKLESTLGREQRQIAEAHELRYSSKAAFEAHQLHAIEGIVALSREKCNNLQQQREKLAQLLNQQRAALQKASQERETVETLLKKRADEARLEETRVEQRSIDDLYGSRGARRRASALQED